MPEPDAPLAAVPPAPIEPSGTPDATPVTALPMPEPEPDGGRMTIMGHLLELRQRLFYCALFMFLSTTIGLIYYEPIYEFLCHPILKANLEFKDDPNYQKLLENTDDDANEPNADGSPPPVIQLQEIRPLALMLILMKAAFWAGIVVTSPFLLYQIWAFVSPGLTLRERRAIRPVLFGGVFFFLGGAAFCYFAVFPYTLNFLVWLNVSLGVLTRYTSSDFIDLLLTFMLIFGLIFELPVLAGVLARLGILSPRITTKYWRMITLGTFILGAVVSPSADLASFLMMSGSLLFLYLISILVVWICYPKPIAEAPAE